MLDNLTDFTVLQQLDMPLMLVLVVLLLCGLFAIAAGIRRYLHGKFISASLQSLSGITLILFGMLLFSIAINIYTYDRLTVERPVAEIRFEQLGPQRFNAILTLPDKGTKQSFQLLGDQWQFDARILKWYGWANLLGLDTQYRLERISGRYVDISLERTAPRSVYSLAAEDKVDYWQWINDYQQYIPFVDAYYGNAVYLPMIDEAGFTILISQTGLLARPNYENRNTGNTLW